MGVPLNVRNGWKADIAVSRPLAHPMTMQPGTPLRLLVLSSPALFLLGCTHVEVGAACELTSRCAREGVLTLHPGEASSVGSLAMPDGCLALALPRRIYRHAAQWEGKTVRVIGELWGQPRSTAYRIGLRWVSPGVCYTGRTLYVDRIARLD